MGKSYLFIGKGQGSLDFKKRKDNVDNDSALSSYHAPSTMLSALISLFHVHKSLGVRYYHLHFINERTLGLREIESHLYRHTANKGQNPKAAQICHLALKDW